MFTQPTQIPRSPFASFLTLLFHALLVAIVVAVSAIPRTLPEVVDRRSLVFVAAAPPPPVLRYEPPPPQPEPEPLQAPAPPAPVPEAPKVVEAPVIEKPPILQPRPAPEPPRVVPEPTRVVEPPPVPPAPPQVIVGAFDDAPAAIERPQRALTLADAGFSVDAPSTARTRREAAIVGGFDAAADQDDRRDRPAFIADTGFGAAPSSPAPARTGASVVESGFGAETTAAPAPPPAARPGPTAPAGFGETPSAPGRPAPAAPVARPDTPVDVLYKPTPVYTDEARELRIDGEVAIEVEFTARGTVRVVRIVRGLGHGLDEMARRAAEQIRFTPATRGGVPVDVRTTLTIVFRLT